MEVAASKTATPQAIKRRMGEDEPKSKPDATMEDKETEGLTPEQVVAKYRPKLKLGEESLRSLELTAAKEVIPVVSKQAEAATALAVQPESPRETKEGKKGRQASAPSSISSWTPNSEGEKKEEKNKKKVRGARWGSQPSLEVHLQILAQERMQKQQELERIVEIDRLRKLGVVRRVADEIQSRVRTAPY